ncbi:hypothetical protein TNCV_3471581 [Trichonephila clavipes]|nr:hypothetical protein TNCV_3471581 [Trichonephila clavipes]
MTSILRHITTQQEKTTQLGSRNETTQLGSRNETTQLVSRNETTQLVSRNETTQLCTAVNRLQPPTTAYDRLRPPATAYNRLQPPAPPARLYSRIGFFYLLWQSRFTQGRSGKAEREPRFFDGCHSSF